MNKIRIAIVLATMLVGAALAVAQDTTEVAKASYLIDASQAKVQAAESGKDALIYFYSST